MCLHNTPLLLCVSIVEKRGEGVRAGELLLAAGDVQGVRDSGGRRSWTDRKRRQQRAVKVQVKVKVKVRVKVEVKVSTTRSAFPPFWPERLPKKALVSGLLGPGSDSVLFISGTLEAVFFRAWAEHFATNLILVI